MDAIALLEHDHREVEMLFRQFEKLTERAHKSKEKIVLKVIRELAIHAAIEEMLFYPAVRTAGLKSGNRAGKKAAETVLESLEEHHVVKWTLSELEKGLDALLAEGEIALDQGKYQEARDAIVRVMPMRPGDARTAAAMGGAMRGLGRTEMAERTLSRALQLDPRQPRALYEMGKLLAARGDRTAAAQSFAALKSAAPEFARIHHVDDELKRLR